MLVAGKCIPVSAITQWAISDFNQEAILAFWAVECYAIVPGAIHKYCSAFLSIVGHVEHAKMLKC